MFVGAKVANTATQTVNSGQNAPLTFDTVNFDVGGFWDPAMPDRLTVPQTLGGRYLIGATVPYAASVDITARRVSFQKNGVAIDLILTGLIANAANPTIVSAIIMDFLDDGDFIQAIVSTGALVTQTINAGPVFWITGLDDIQSSPIILKRV